jgi:hypothetical protein
MATRSRVWTESTTDSNPVHKLTNGYHNVSEAGYMEFRAQNPHQDSSQNHHAQQRLQRAQSGMIPSADFNALISNLIDIAEALPCRILCMCERHVLLLQGLSQQFQMKTQFFVNVALDLPAIEMLE